MTKLRWEGSREEGERRRGGSYEGGKGQTWGPVDNIWGGKCANLASHCLDQFLLQLGSTLCMLHESDVGIYALSLHIMLIPAAAVALTFELGT